MLVAEVFEMSVWQNLSLSKYIVHVPVSDCRNVGMSKYWTGEISVCRNIGLSKYQSDVMPVSENIDQSKCWSVQILV